MLYDKNISMALFYLGIFLCGSIKMGWFFKVGVSHDVDRSGNMKRAKILVLVATLISGALFFMLLMTDVYVLFMGVLINLLTR